MAEKIELKTEEKPESAQVHSVFVKEKANYIVVVRRGGDISDVWKLEDAIIRFNEGAKGWEICTNKGANFYVGGDVEIWRIDSKTTELWNVYKSFHRHIAEQSYDEMFLNKPVEIEEPKKKGFLKKLFG